MDGYIHISQPEMTREMQDMVLSMIGLYESGYSELDIEYAKKNGRTGKIRLTLTEVADVSDDK